MYPNLLSAIKIRGLAMPGVASKMFLITIGDRSVGGLTARDQCVGPPSAYASQQLGNVQRRPADGQPAGEPPHRRPQKNGANNA